MISRVVRSSPINNVPLLSDLVQQAILEDNALNLADYYRSNSFSLDSRNNVGQTALHFAALHGKLNSVVYLCAKQDPNQYDLRHEEHEMVHAHLGALDNDRCTPLHLASKNGHYDVVDHLCKHKHFNKRYFAIRDQNHFSALCLAIQNEQIAIMNYFFRSARLSRKIDNDVKNDKEALYAAAMKGQLELMKIFNMAKEDEAKVLSIAAECGHLDIVRYLCEHLGVSVTASVGHRRPLHIASDSGQLHIVHYLSCRDAARMPNVTESGEKVTDGTIALHTAIKKRRDTITTYLCDTRTYDININHKINGCSALQLAIQTQDPNAVKFLLCQRTLDLQEVIRNLNSLKANIFLREIRADVESKKNQLAAVNPLHSLVRYFNGWDASHWCWNRIDPNRYVFAYMILNTRSENDRDALIAKILATDKIPSWSDNSFRRAIQDMYQVRGPVLSNLYGAASN